MTFFLVTDKIHLCNQVYDRLQKLNISMSYVTTIRLVTAVGEGHDEVVKMWRDNPSSHLNNVQVSTILFVRISQLLKDIQQESGVLQKTLGSSGFSDEESTSSENSTSNSVQYPTSISLISSNDDRCTLSGMTFSNDDCICEHKKSLLQKNLPCLCLLRNLVKKLLA